MRTAELGPLWERVRERLETTGVDNRGRVKTPLLVASGRLALENLLGKRITRTVNLADLESALTRLGVGDDLASALAALGHAVSSEPAQRRDERAKRQTAHSAARSEAATWLAPWAEEWIDDVIRAGVLRGLDAPRATALVDQVRRIFDAIPEDDGAPVSRVDLAARVLGSSHALDTGTRLETAVARALRYRLGADSTNGVWEQSGIHLDLTSGPVLTWRLPLVPDSALAPTTDAATRAGIPLHLTRFALQVAPARVSPGTRLLVVENPRIVEAAAQARTPTSVITTNGQPSGAVLLLLEQLAESGADLRYHGDFDTPGLAICERMTTFGLTPWRMSASDYRQALAAADRADTPLPREPNEPGPTSWDPDLRTLFDLARLIVHEERLLPDLLDTPLE